MKRKGICSICGCTHESPCDEGCGWANVKQTLCTACEPLSPAERDRRTKEAKTELCVELGMAQEGLRSLIERMQVLGHGIRGVTVEVSPRRR